MRDQKLYSTVSNAKIQDKFWSLLRKNNLEKWYSWTRTILSSELSFTDRANEIIAITFQNVLKKHKTQATTSISEDDWFEYFSNLCNIDSQSVESLSEDNIQEISDDILDSPITNAEVLLAIKDLKNGKSAGADGIV